MNIFTNYLESKYRTINSEIIIYKKMTACGMPQISAEANTELEIPITMEELRTAINKGKCRKTTGPDGICHEYYKQMWNCCKEDLLDVINNMFIDGPVTNDKKHGNIVCLPKACNPVSPVNYRPLTILNTDYKLHTRIFAYRLLPWMEDMLNPKQYCGRNGKSIFDAVAPVRDIIAYAETTDSFLCLLSIEFSDAFDKISHTFLFKILQEYGISEIFCQGLRNIYADATSTLVLNGHKSKPIKIQSGVRQGCPLSMMLFAACINPLLITLDKRLQGVKVSHPSTKTTAKAYADDITIVLRHEEIDEVRGILNDYMNASGANINEYKSCALALGTWPKSAPIMNIRYTENIKILGFQMNDNCQHSAEMSWTTPTSKIRAQSMENYHRH